MKVPIEVDGNPTPEMNDEVEASEAPTAEAEPAAVDAEVEAAPEDAPAEEPVVEPAFDEFDEEAMVEAAKRAGAAAAEEDLKADAERARELADGYQKAQRELRDPRHQSCPS